MIARRFRISRRGLGIPTGCGFSIARIPGAETPGYFQAFYGRGWM